MIPYILHVSILIAAATFSYRLLLKKLTFYALNRWILLGCLLVAFVLPLLPIPRAWSWQAPVAAAAATPVVSTVVPVRGEPMGAGAAPAPSSTAARGEHTAVPAAVFHRKPTELSARVAAPQKQAAAPLPPVPSPPVATSATVAAGGNFFPRMLSVLFYLYLFGVIVLGGNMLRQVIMLLVQRYKAPVIRDGQYRIIATAGVHGPCSFGKMIFIHPHRYDPDTYHQILLHEKVHAGGWHTVDILLAEIGIVFQWFNPFIWWFRRELENNLEFLTDRHVLRHPGIDRSAYQLSLIKVAAPDVPLSISSNYNQSLLKRRIIMMNAQNSARHTAWKYFILLPLFIFLTWILNRPAALAQDSKHSRKAQVLPVLPAPVVNAAPVAAPVVAMAPVAALQPVERPLATLRDGQAPLSIPGIQRGPAPDIQPGQAPVPAPVPVPIPPMDTSKPSSRADRMEGSWFITNYKQDNKGDNVTIELRDQDDDHRWNSSFTVARRQLFLSGVGKVEFALTREAGTMHFSGQFDGEQGFGHYKFQPDAAYLSQMRQQKVVMEEDELLSFFLLDIKKDYADMLHSNGYPDISKNHLISMAALGIDKPYIQGVREMGYADISENHLITFKALHIDKEFIDDVRKAGYDHLPAEKLITFKSLKIDGAYLRRFPASTPPQDIITYKSLRIDSDYVASLRREGYPDLASREIVSLRSLNVTPEFINGFHAIGYKDIPVHNLISLKSLNITPDYVKGFLALGYKDISVNHLASLKSMGITPEFIKEFNAIGFKDIPLNQLASVKAMGVTPAYVSKMKEKGFVSDDLNKYIRLKNAFD
ncbi:M56 family metallopeptidase [Flavitalea sp. BT771]|uniref:M56 family metallopeptidase n=1 Tax=Flavitalea sp. BT771 TaxID=3063329 RepID=UPI0026E2D4EF|nr:M56 family metallopeptidase [Flavitalea sp. BT771]MDO6434721.1 M56 family metallopeptidase [Flavitalea sp. BT771]MDV6223621.1 M56 family metallopeptidase [Flavitalea sp. BT771]